MPAAELWSLAAIAGFTIFLGLPVGRLRAPAPRLRTALCALAVGVLAFLFVDILSHANEPVENALDAAKNDGGSWWRFAGYGALLAAGLGLGLVGLVFYERVSKARRDAPPKARSLGAAAIGVSGGPRSDLLDDVPAHGRQLALYIAVGIGLHNFAEGLSIGQSAARGDISLAVLLIVGFGLHNATEGFGIVAPMAADTDHPSIRYLALLGLIGGAPTLIGTVVGNSFVNDALYLAFLALAAGSILYVVIQLVQVAAKLGHKEVFAAGILGGLLAGLATDYVLVAAGV